MQTGQTLGERVKMLEAGCVVKDAEITRLHAEVARLRDRLEDKTNSLRVEIAAKQGAHNEIKMLLDAITTADLQIGDGHIGNARETLHAAMDDTPSPTTKPEH